jgi:hypothetical protein
MTDTNARIQSMVAGIMGNESLVEMLETEAATEMLNWGIATAKTLVSKTMDLDDFAAELAIVPRLKAIRQSMRSIGNWAAGKYADPESRVQLREKLLEYFKLIFGEEARLPSAEKLDALLNEADDKNNTPHQLVLKLRKLIEEAS